MGVLAYMDFHAHEFCFTRTVLKHCSISFVLRLLCPLGTLAEEG